VITIYLYSNRINQYKKNFSFQSSNKKIKKIKKILAKYKMLYYNLGEVEKSGTKWWKVKRGEI